MSVHSVPLVVVVLLFWARPIPMITTHGLFHAVILWVFTIRNFDVCVRVGEAPYHFCDWRQPKKAFIVTWIFVAVCLGAHYGLTLTTDRFIF